MVLNSFSARCLALCLVVLVGGCAALHEPAPGGPSPVPSGVSAPATPQTRAPRLGLALGGGAARGFAHVGVIQVLEQAGIHPDLVAGTSAGSLVAALYASGKSGTELERLALSMEEATITDWSLPIFGRGLLRGDALARYVREAVDGRLIDQMAVPLGILATDLHTGKGVLFRRGDTAQAVRASSAVPGVFTPVAISGTDYVDGGLVAPVPVRQAREMGAEVVVAIDISSAPDSNASNGGFQVLLQTFAIMGQSINRHELRDADLVVRPDLGGMGGAAFAQRQRAIEAGRAAMRAQLPRLHAVLRDQRRPL